MKTREAVEAIVRSSDELQGSITQPVGVGLINQPMDYMGSTTSLRYFSTVQTPEGLAAARKIAKIIACPVSEHDSLADYKVSFRRGKEWTEVESRIPVSLWPAEDRLYPIFYERMLEAIERSMGSRFKRFKNSLIVIR